MRNQKGFTGLEIAGVIAVVGLVVLLAPKLNPFSNAADPANRRTASAISGKDIVEITNHVAESEKPVTVKIDRSVEASSETTDPKLTIGQRIGRFFSGLGTWGIILVGLALAAGIITPAGILGWWKMRYKNAFKSTVAAIRETDDETFNKIKPKLAAYQDKKDKQLVDKVKSELH